MPRPPLPVTVDRLLARTRHGDGGCLLWQGGATARGYGVISVRGRQRLAHRVMFELVHGDLGTAEVDHTCDVPACIAPAHLERVTRLGNEERKTARGRRPVGKQPAPCGKCGGPRNLESKRGDGRSFWTCAPCVRAYQAAYHRGRRNRGGT